jgi:YesN/AraC family two-component response regulator
MLNYDIYWLSRMIKKHSGKTFTELMQVKKLNQAAFLLRTTKMTVSDIGNSVGYDNLSYFHRIFKKKFGMSPKNFRSENKYKLENENAREDTFLDKKCPFFRL